MPTGSRLRTACQGCHTRGRFRRLEVTVYWQGVHHLRYLTFCAACRSSWLELTFGKRGLQSGGHAQPDSESTSSEAIGADARMYPRRSRRFQAKVDLYRGAS